MATSLRKQVKLDAGHSQLCRDRGQRERSRQREQIEDAAAGEGGVHAQDGDQKEERGWERLNNWWQRCYSGQSQD